MNGEYKTFYGEFSLAQWLKMILKNEIVLPEYQRNFVWKIKDVKRLIESLKEDCIVPPVIIAQNQNKNYLLDGQQRLSSILLAYLGVFPKSNDSKQNNVYNSDVHTHDLEDDIQEQEYEKLFYWQFTIIQELFEKCEHDKSKLKNMLLRDTVNYSPENYGVCNNFFDDNFMGYAFSRRMPHAITDAHTHFSKTFHAINTSGTKLSGHESRRAYYWLKPELSKLFEPDFTKAIFIEQPVGNKYVIDFVRPLSFAVEQFVSRGNNTDTSSVAKGYAKKFEDYFTGFIKRYVGLDENDEFIFFGDISTTLPTNTIENRIEHIRQLCQIDAFLPKFTAAYEYDYYFFGLVYWVVAQGKKVEITDMQNFNTQMKRKIDAFRGDTNNTNKYNSLGRIRSRLVTSMQIYEQYVTGDI